MKNLPEFKKAIYLTIGMLVFSTFITLGRNYLINYNTTITQGEETRTKKVYSLLSYLELVKGKEGIKEVSQKNLLTDTEILRFKLNSQGKVEEMVEDSSLWGKQKLRVSSPEEYKTIDWNGVNQTAQRYIAYFKEK